MTVHRIDVDHVSEEPRWVALLSDLHIGSSTTKIERIVDDLQRAKRLDADILINGDVIDAILPGDMKRFTMAALPKRLRCADDVLQEQVEWAVEVLAPYATNIRQIGSGNHETAVEKRHHMDPITMIVDRLNQNHGGRVAHGGICGFVRWHFKRSTHTWSWKLYRHHGAGGAAPVTMGTLDFSRMQWAVADAVWIGHKHNRLAFPRQKIALSNADKVEERDYWNIMSGAYGCAYEEAEGRRGRNYAQDANMAPQPMGGVFVSLTPRQGTGGMQVDVSVQL